MLADPFPFSGLSLISLMSPESGIDCYLFSNSSKGFLGRAIQLSKVIYREIREHSYCFIGISWIGEGLHLKLKT